MITRHKKSFIAAMAVIWVTFLVTNTWAFDKGRFLEHLQHKGIKNVIVMVPDGCDETVQTVARWYKGEDLQLDKMQGGAVKVHMADSIIPDSAAAATQFACGVKTSDGFVGVGPRADTLLSIYSADDMSEPYAPVASILEAAKMKGKATGIAVTCRISHATPAGFASHVPTRNDENGITEQMVYNNIDVVFGGGARHLIPKGESYTTAFGATWSGSRTDGENLIKVLAERGYTFVDNKDDMDALRHGKVWGLFDDSHLEADIDRAEFGVHQPSLAEMTSKAIELLSKDRDGFFLHVEGSQVDWAGHANDPIYMVTDFLAFDDAVKAACDFADRDGHTIVLAFPDHNTGGMKIGQYYYPVGYTKTKVEDLVGPLTGMKLTSTGLARKIGSDLSSGNIIAKVQEWWGLTITEADVEEIIAWKDGIGGSLDYALSHVISRNYTVIGWTTHGHNGETVPLWIHGMDAPVGVIDDTMLATMAADAINADLGWLTGQLYVDINTATDDYEIDVTTDPENPVLKVKGAEFPASKDYMIYRGRMVKLPGLTVYAPNTGKMYVSKKALWLLRLL